MILIAALHAFLDAKLLLQVSFKWKKNPMENNFSAVRSESNRPTPGPRPGAELSIRCPHLLRGWRFTAHARVHIDARGFDPHQVVATCEAPQITMSAYNSGPGRMRYVGEHLVVIADPAVRVIVTVLLRTYDEWDDADARAAMRSAR